jgi:ABC-type lipoprotein export system ATPase subunit
MHRSDLFKTKGFGVRVRKIVKNYRTSAEEVHALRGVDWDVEPGQAVAIMGPSGCGKTTLLNLIGGVDRASGGTIHTAEDDLTAMNERDLERYRLNKVGFVFQLFNLIPTMTALENIELPMMVAGTPERDCRERAGALLDIVGLKAKGNKRPDELSGGEQQRVGVALALANDPPLILADEPTGNLDSHNADVISELLVSLASDFGKTVIMVSHDAKSVAHFPIGYGMRDGQFTASDPALDLIGRKLRTVTTS